MLCYPNVAAVVLTAPVLALLCEFACFVSKAALFADVINSAVSCNRTDHFDRLNGSIRSTTYNLRLTYIGGYRNIYKRQIPVFVESSGNIGGVVSMDKMKLLEELKQRIMSNSGIQDEQLAADIARKWVTA